MIVTVIDTLFYPAVVAALFVAILAASWLRSKASS